MKNKTKRKNRIFRVLLATMLILFGVSFRNDGKIGISGVQSVQAATKNVVVRFWNQSGKTSYSKLRIKVSAGKKIKLPAVPAITGYKNLGWSTQKNDTKAVYAAGKKIRLKKNINLYAVRKKVGIYKVYFYDNTGSTSTVFKKLNKAVTKNGYLTLPELPQKSGYKAVGWSTKKNASQAAYTEGQKIRIKKNIKLYAVYESDTTFTVALCKNDGTVYKTENVASGSSYTLPSVRNASGYTFMGWDIQLGKSTAPRYEAGDTITVNSNIKLYAVVFNRSAEEDLTLSELLQSASSWKIGNGSSRGYNHIIFVGDSRTNRMQRTLQKLNSGYYESNLLRDIDFVYEEGKGLEWLKSQGMNTILSIAEENYSVLKPTAVIFNLGVNDPGNMYDYISYYQEIAESLQKKNCKLFFMSVNPVNSKTIEYLGKNAIRKEEVIRIHPRTLRRDQCRRLLRCRSLQDHRGLPFAVGREPEPLLHGRLRPRQDPFGQRYRFARRLRRGCCGQPHLDGRAHADRTHARRQNRLPRRRRRRSIGRGHAGVDEPLWLHPRFLYLFQGVFQDVARREQGEPQSRVLHPDDGQQTHRRRHGLVACAPLCGAVARRHLQGGQTRAGGLDREDDRRGQISPQPLGIIAGCGIAYAKGRMKTSALLHIACAVPFGSRLRKA